jgi:DNA polymerase
MSVVTHTQYDNHKTKWIDCQECLLCKCRTNVVIARGKIPSDILFIGEAPGDSEDVIGKPFVGPAGRLLDHIIEQSLDGQHDYTMTNIVCCIPKDVGNAKGEPPKEAILACRPRLLEFIEICQPKLIVTVGLLSSKFLPILDNIRKIGITHPAAILRMDASQQSLAIKRCVVAVEDAVAAYL